MNAGTTTAGWTLPILNVMAPTVAGGVVYVLWRGDHLRLFSWLQWARLGSAVDGLRAVASGIRLPDMVVYSLPNALWTFAFVHALALATKQASPPERACWLAVPVLLSLGGEVAQYCGAIAGTFDVADFTLALGASALALVTVAPGDQTST